MKRISDQPTYNPDIQGHRSHKRVGNFQNQGHNSKTQATRDVITISTAPTTETTTTAYSRPTTIENLPLVPEDSSYLNLAKMEVIRNEFNEDNLIEAVVSIHDLKEATEILKWLDARNKKGSLMKCIENILSYYSENEIRQSEFLRKNFKLSILSQGYATYRINQHRYSYSYEKLQDKNSLEKMFKGRIISKLLISNIAFKNDNISTVDKIFRHVLERANSFLNFTASDRDAHNIVNHYLWSFIDFVKPEYQNNLIFRYQSYLAKNMNIASAVSRTLIDNKAINEAQEFLERALANRDEQHNEIYLGDCLFNMGVALGRQRKYQQSLEYHLQAYEMLPEDATALKELIAIAYVNGRLEIAREAARKFPNSQLKTLLLASFDLSSLDSFKTSIIKDMKGSDIPKEFHDILYCMKFVIAGRIWLKGEEIDEPSFTKGIKILEAKNVNKILVLSICLIFNQINIAQKIIKGIAEEIIIATPILQKFNAFLQDHKSTSLVDKIESYDISEQEKAQLHFDAASACIAEEELEQAGQHLATAIALEPLNQTYIQADLLRTALSNDIMKLEDYSSKMDQEEREEIFAEFSSNIEAFDKSLTKETKADELLQG